MGDKMRDWKAKLTSRKFWAAVVGVVISVMVAFGADSETQDKTVGVITASATLIAYIIGEGLTDSASVKLEIKQAEQQPENSFFISVPDADKAK